VALALRTGFLYDDVVETSYTEARQNLARLLDRVVEDRSVVFIRRRSRERVALVAADELASLMETAHLLRSPKNASRLLSALRRALRNTGRPKSVARLRDELGLGR
jgi:antitoxin YefM